MKNLSFGQALEAVKTGKLIARSGWNGKGMFVFQRPEDELQVDFLVGKVKSLPDGVKDYYRNLFEGYTSFNGAPPAPIKFNAYLCMKASDGTIVNGWLASQTDILAEDWQILN
jgi:hypothetical protein